MSLLVLASEWQDSVTGNEFFFDKTSALSFFWGAGGENLLTSAND